jgi:hypothetical protein
MSIASVSCFRSLFVLLFINGVGGCIAPLPALVMSAKMQPAYDPNRKTKGNIK